MLQVLKSNRLNYWTGEECRSFEREFAEFAGSQFAIALSNGTVALELALAAMDIGPGMEVVVPPRTFIATASAVVNVGAVPVFADVDPDSGNLTVESVAEVLSPRTAAIIPVHLAGWPCDMDPLLRLARDHSLRILEDCAQAHGARYRGRSVGSLGDVGAWSFCQDKIITTGGEGGMITTNDRDLWARIWALKDHGKSWAAVYERDHPPGYRWLHDGFGTNARLTEMQAAIGRVQLRKMREWTASRTANAKSLEAALAPFAGPTGPVRLPVGQCEPKAGCAHAFYKFYAYVRPDRLAPGWNRDRVIAELVAAGVPCYQGSCSEVYLEKAFDRTESRPAKRLPVARQLGETSLMFLVHPTLGPSEMDRCRSALWDILSQAAAPNSGLPGFASDHSGSS